MIEVMLSSALSQTGPAIGGRGTEIDSACAAAVHLVIEDITDRWSRQENPGDRNVFDFYERFVCTPGEEGTRFVSTYQRNATRGGVVHYLVDVIDMRIVEMTAER